MNTEDKLALCIFTLKAISGDPALDEEVFKVTGETEISTSQKRARMTLTELGVDLGAPVSKRIQ